MRKGDIIEVDRPGGVPYLVAELHGRKVLVNFEFGTIIETGTREGERVVMAHLCTARDLLKSRRSWVTVRNALKELLK